ncbi:hypothetical protein BU24DRAFT_453946 [Aaosphaeria arxii CBS 175.79]|uniref:Uncharacterized protein n=1 Tax=Aaosphaeria arxii CBS 175.79 TaxID=1450172 RepID=A0A6A5XE09_9PLEO|nr:uncharacterized protein BU24DRAFT_453946 [Aaosphaeria arxii CBS 175.79]KAF2011385.1 hypothetical protein BU24DRAFT_453946 [Aaosphaeria arxii CBS 175.79]
MSRSGTAGTNITIMHTASIWSHPPTNHQIHMPNPIPKKCPRNRTHPLSPITTNMTTPTALGPLPTNFVPPSSCTVALAALCTSTSCAAEPPFKALYGASCLTSKTPITTPAPVADFNPDCLPSGKKLAEISAKAGGGEVNAYFSPASDCPGGWSAATSGSDGKVFKGIGKAETGVVCCPSSFTWDITNGCRAPPTFTQQVSFCAGDPNTIKESTAITTWLYGAGSAAGGLYAPAIQLRYNGAASPTTSTSTSPPLTTNSKPTGPAIDWSDPAGTHKCKRKGGNSGNSGHGYSGKNGKSGGKFGCGGKKKGLSKGAVIAIAVVVPVVVIGGAVLAWVLVRRKRAKGYDGVASEEVEENGVGTEASGEQGKGIVGSEETGGEDMKMGAKDSKVVSP